MAPFYILGGVLAAWAVVVTALGIMRKDFPGSVAGERVVIGISVVLVAGAIGSGVITAANQEAHGGSGEAAEAEEQPAGEGGAQEPANAQEDEAPPAPTEDAPPAGSPAAAEGEEAAAGEPLEIQADPGGELAFDVDSLEASAGTVEISMDNPSSVPHNVAIDGNGVDEEGDVVTQGGTSTVSAQLDPGTYSFYCSVPGHRQAGMEGILTVE